MLRQRVLTAAVILPLFLAALLFLPNAYFSVLIAAVLALAAREWARIVGLGPTGQLLYAAGLTIAALGILLLERASVSGPFIYSAPGKLLYGLCATFWLAIVPVWLLFCWQTRERALLGLVGIVVLLPFWHAFTSLQLSPGRLLVVLGVVWTADTAAYFAGRAYGRRKLAPSISPGKTWEGVAGALLAVLGYWIGVSLLVPGLGENVASGLALAILLTVLSIQGDLFESWMKRLAGFKDSGTLLPGHGGVLDRIDGLIATLPFAALFFAYPMLRLA
jgi:phosphatidate cytidylyltransferase